MLLVVDQEKHKSTIPPLDCRHPMFWWIFKNIDYTSWSSASFPGILWLSGPPERNIHQVSSYIVNQEKNRALNTQHLVLYFFCSASIRKDLITTVFVHTLLYQIVCCSPTDKGILIIRTFLHRLLEEALRNEAVRNWKEVIEEDSTIYTNIKKILDASANALWTALEAVLSEEPQRELCVVIDGLDRVEHQKVEFINGVRVFFTRLLNRTSKLKALLTSRPQTEIKEALDGVLCIEYDKERKGMATPYFLALNSTHSNG